jgi:hypothetical protein
MAKKKLEDAEDITEKIADLEELQADIEYEISHARDDASRKAQLQAQWGKNADELERLDEVHATLPDAYNFKCPLCYNIIHFKRTKKGDSYAAFCDVCHLRAFLRLPSWENRRRLRKIAKAMRNVS